MRLLAFLLFITLSACHGGPQESDHEVPHHVPQLY